MSEENEILYQRKSELINAMNSVIVDYARKYSNHTEDINNYFIINMPLNDNLSIKEKTDKANEFINSVFKTSDYNLNKFLKDVDMPFDVVNNENEIDKDKSYGQLGLKMSKELLCVLYFEFTSMGRTRYSREFDRILVSNAFRHLQYKTQVMNNSASDDQRTRLLHSLEVQRIAKILAVQLKANWELAEAIAIGHDVGHTPFGHTGEEALNKCLELRFFGRFSHALQSAKVLNFLEHHEVMAKYGLGGIGLSKSVLDGILRHDTDSFINDLSKPGFKLQYNCPELLNKRKINNEVVEEEKDRYFEIGGIESQIVYWADKIAYLAHDWEEFALGDVLDKITNRIYSHYHKMNRYIRDTRDFLNNEEFQLMNDICNTINELNKLYNPINAQTHILKDISFETKVKEKLQKLEQIEKIKLNEKYLKIFSLTEYKNLFSYFSVALAWFNLTDKIPERNDGNIDIIYIINNYLKTTGTRIIKSRVEHKLLVNTAKEIEEIENNIGEPLNIESFILISNESLKDNTRKAKESKKILDKKELRDIYIKSLIVTLDDNSRLQMQFINNFIFDKYIKSTNVINMNNKANIIIPVLFEYYFKNYQMLPNEQRNRYRRELLMHKYDKSYQDVLKENYIERIEKIYKGNCDSWHKSNKYEVPCYDEIKKKIFDKTYMYNNNVSREDLLRYYNDFYELLEKERKIYNEHEIHEYDITEDELRDTLLGQCILARVVVDYIASMTDRMATKKYDEIKSSKVKWSATYSE